MSKLLDYWKRLEEGMKSEEMLEAVEFVKASKKEHQQAEEWLIESSFPAAIKAQRSKLGAALMLWGEALTCFIYQKHDKTKECLNQAMREAVLANERPLVEIIGKSLVRYSKEPPLPWNQ